MLQRFLSINVLIYNMSKGTTSTGELNSSKQSVGPLDQFIKEIYLILYYSESDPGYEYELINGNELAEGWQTLAVGEKVFSTFGKAKVQGEIVAISEDKDYMNSQFQNITTRHSQELEDIYMEKRQVSRGPMRYFIQPVIKVTDAATQTDPVSTEWRDKYQELQQKYTQIREVFNAAKCNIEEMIGETKLASHSGRNMNSASSLSPVTTKTPLQAKENIENKDFNSMIQIGSNGTKIAKAVYDAINWTSYTAATRKLLVTLFPREVLASHSLSGKPSPAFLHCNKQKKARLNPTIVSDIVEIVSMKSKVSGSMVKSAITTKCSDENKLLRKKMNKKK